MRRTISSAQTFLMKVIFPSIWIGGFAIVTFLMSSGAFSDDPGNPLPQDIKGIFLGATLAGGGFIYWSCIRLKRVELDDQALYVSNYRTEISVPLRDVEEITENRWVNIHPVTIRFHRDTDFGSSVTFMPTVRWFALFTSHPIVAELRRAVARARGTS